jgi:hypothetical protein
VAALSRPQKVIRRRGALYLVDLVAVGLPYLDAIAQE